MPAPARAEQHLAPGRTAPLCALHPPLCSLPGLHRLPGRLHPDREVHGGVQRLPLAGLRAAQHAGWVGGGRGRVGMGFERSPGWALCQQPPVGGPCTLARCGRPLPRGLPGLGVLRGLPAQGAQHCLADPCLRARPIASHTCRPTPLPAQAPSLCTSTPTVRATASATTTGSTTRWAGELGLCGPGAESFGMAAVSRHATSQGGRSLALLASLGWAQGSSRGHVRLSKRSFCAISSRSYPPARLDNEWHHIAVTWSWESGEVGTQGC